MSSKEFSASLYNRVYIKNSLRGTFRFQDIYETGNGKLVQEVKGMQRRIQFDDPANIQFTSVF